MRRARAAAACVLACSLVCTGCATPMGRAQDVPDLQPGEIPRSDTTEAGFWLLLDRVESDVATSGAVVRDPALNAYLSDVVCRISGDYCRDLRVYLLAVPHFNASMYPNGMMHVWTGLLLRCENEAQLAAVLGHEIGHYVKRHTLKRWKDVSAKADLLQVLAIGLGAVGAGGVASLASITAQLSVLAYGREQEREADEIGFELLTRAGYAPEEVAELWEYLVREHKAGDVDRPPTFLSSHPAPEERVRTLRARALEVGGGRRGERHAERFLLETLPWRSEWLAAELGLRQFDQSEVVLDRVRATGTGLAEVAFFQGELHRLRGETGDEDQALTQYSLSIQLDPGFAESHRALGLQLLKRGETAEGSFHLRRYLELEPASEDRAIIEFYLAQAGHEAGDGEPAP